MTHFSQFLYGDLNPRAPGYFSHGRIMREAYLSDSFEIEARETAVIMEDSFRRYANNYRWNVPCEILLQKHDRNMKIVDPRAPNQATWSGFITAVTVNSDEAHQQSACRTPAVARPLVINQENEMKQFSELALDDLVGIDHGHDIKSVARVTRVTPDKIDLWVINGWYPIQFDRQSGITDDYSKTHKLVILDDMSPETRETLLEIEEKSNPMRLDDAKEYQDQYRELFRSVLSFESDPSLNEDSAFGMSSLF
jgi:hypothetical protein